MSNDDETVERELLREALSALQAFEKVSGVFEPHDWGGTAYSYTDDYEPFDMHESGDRVVGLTVGDLRRARAAAALIRAQAERVRVLEGALKPFADEAALWADMWADDFHPIQDTSVSCSQCGESMEKPERARFTIGDLRRARAAADKIRAALTQEKP